MCIRIKLEWNLRICWSFYYWIYIFTCKLACIYSYCRTNENFGSTISCQNLDIIEESNMATIEGNSTDCSSSDPLILGEDTVTLGSPIHTVATDPGRLSDYSRVPLLRNDSGSSLNSPNTPSTPPAVYSKPFQGPRFKLIHEGDIQICRLNHTRTIVSKIMNSRYLRRWESHHIILGKTEMRSATVSYSCKSLFFLSHLCL